MSDPGYDQDYGKEYQMVNTLHQQLAAMTKAHDTLADQVALDTARIITVVQQLTAMTERDRVRHEDYQRACGMIAAMHRAAMGVTCGPSRGVVEDVEDLRTAFTAGQQEIARLKRLVTDMDTHGVYAEQQGTKEGG